MKISTNIIGALLITAIGTGAFIMMAKRPDTKDTALNFGVVNTGNTGVANTSSANKEPTPTSKVTEVSNDDANKTTDDTADKYPASTSPDTQESAPGKTDTSVSTDSRDENENNNNEAKAAATEQTPASAKVSEPDTMPESAPPTIKQESAEKQTVETETAVSPGNNSPEIDKPAETPQTINENHQAAPQTTQMQEQQNIAPPVQAPVAPEAPKQEQETPQNPAPAATTSTPQKAPAAVTTPVESGNTGNATSPQAVKEQYRQQLIKALQQQLKALQENPDMPIMAPNGNNQTTPPSN